MRSLLNQIWILKNRDSLGNWILFAKTYLLSGYFFRLDWRVNPAAMPEAAPTVEELEDEASKSITIRAKITNMQMAHITRELLAAATDWLLACNDGGCNCSGFPGGFTHLLRGLSKDMGATGGIGWFIVLTKFAGGSFKSISFVASLCCCCCCCCRWRAASNDPGDGGNLDTWLEGLKSERLDSWSWTWSW